MFGSGAASNALFAQVYWKKYLQPRRQTFAIVIEQSAFPKSGCDRLRRQLDP
jgi:hypothetical protein